MSRVLPVMLSLCLSCAAAKNNECEATFNLQFPDGTQTTLEFCADSSINADFEFDPDNPPEVRNLELEFHATVEAGFECWVKIHEPGVCGVGTYCVEDSVGEVVIDTHDCAGASDEFEGQFRATTGSLRIDLLEAGNEPGNFSGKPLDTRVSGTVMVQVADGLTLQGAFDLTQQITATDAEEAECSVSDEACDGLVEDDTGEGSTTCADGEDNDGDGWLDLSDPDCDASLRSDGSAPVEDNLVYGEFTCNDGIDNDEDGQADRDDSDCSSGADREDNCGDGEDNDTDGWTDGYDGECIEGGSEQGTDAWSCSDGRDNDEDGWFDTLDPDCLNGMSEELGYGSTQCNNGLDDDKDKATDADDAECVDAADDDEAA